MKRDQPLTPRLEKIGDDTWRLIPPACVFPSWREDGAPSHVKVLLPEHPLAKGLPAAWYIPHTEMYEDPFHVPAPDATVFEEHWDKGEHFKSGLVWHIGKGGSSISDRGMKHFRSIGRKRTCASWKTPCDGWGIRKLTPARNRRLRRSRSRLPGGTLRRPRIAKVPSGRWDLHMACPIAAASRIRARFEVFLSSLGGHRRGLLRLKIEKLAWQ